MTDETQRLVDMVQALLDLHIAHHNHPTHAAARALLRTMGDRGPSREGVQPDPKVAAMVSAAAEAQEMFGDDYLESWAAGYFREPRS